MAHFFCNYREYGTNDKVYVDAPTTAQLRLQITNMIPGTGVYYVTEFNPAINGGAGQAAFAESIAGLLSLVDSNQAFS